MKKILVVDNHPVMLNLLENLLKKHGHQVKTAKDGLTALDLLKTWIPNIIFIDLVMPNIGGDKLCQIIRKIPELKDVYIAIVSAVAVEEERDVTEFGANSCIAKGPFNSMAKHILDVLDASDHKTSSIFRGQILGIDHVDARDITKELLSVRDHFEVILGRMSEGILEITSDCRVVYANPTALTIIEKPEEQVLAKDFTDIFDLSDRKRIRSLLGRELTSPEKIPEDESVKLDDKDITLDFIPLKDRENKSIVILSDVTERKRMKAQIIHAMEQAEEMAVQAEAANKAKSAFLASMSHEIRTPLNSVIGFTDMLLKSSLNEDEIEYAKTIKQSGEVLLSLINDILDFSKIEAGRLDLEKYDFDLESTIYHTCELIRPQIGTKPIELLCRVAGDVPGFVIGDAGRFQQVLINLMGNAAKFTESGEIELTVKRASQKEDRVDLHITVRDTGEAIPQEKLEMIFEVFQQADSSTTRKYGGTGLGLAICRKIAQLMDGEVWAESDPKKGNIFHFTARFAPSDIKPDDEVDLSDLSGKRILIVENNKTHVDILQDILTAQQVQVESVASGDIAVQMIQRAAKGKKPFNCCMIDVQQNGCDIQDELRNSKTKTSNLPLIGFSVPLERHANECIDAGFDGFLSTPIRRYKLLMMLAELLSETKEAADAKDSCTDVATEADNAEINDSHETVSILVAEDNLMSQKLMKLMFTKAGYRVDVAGNGIEVVEKFTRAPDTFDMIFMDVQMPEKDGLCATREIRAWEEKNDRHKHIPIVAFTANAMKGDREMCLNAGMDDYVAKPIQIDTVLGAIKKWVAHADPVG